MRSYLNVESINDTQDLLLGSGHHFAGRPVLDFIAAAGKGVQGKGVRVE